MAGAKVTLVALLALLPACLLQSALADLAEWDPDCISEPVGFGRYTIGGKGGRVLYPETREELTKYLLGSEPRTVVLDRTFDFSDAEGWSVGPGCFFLECGKGFQYSRDHAGTCTGRKMTTVNYRTAGLTPLDVGSNISIIGKDGKGVLRGKGLRIKDAKNIIIKGISVVDINPDIIWGGDAISIDGAENVWIHQVTVKNIGRQHLVTYQTTNRGITVSSCTFDGRTPNSAYCDGAHYWTWLFWGRDDQITLINNRVIETSGRIPHAGGYAGAKSFVHLVGNVFEKNTHVGIEPRLGSNILVEGNHFDGMNYLINPKATDGLLHAANSASEAATCRAHFGENCLVNQITNTKRSMNRTDKSALELAQPHREAINHARKAVCFRY